MPLVLTLFFRVGLFPVLANAMFQYLNNGTLVRVFVEKKKGVFVEKKKGNLFVV